MLNIFLLDFEWNGNEWNGHKWVKGITYVDNNLLASLNWTDNCWYLKPKIADKQYRYN